MKNCLSILTIALLLVSCGEDKKPPVDPTVYGNTITSEELKDMLFTYASDEFEGRETGEPGQKKAVNYLKDQYKAMDIASPLSEDDYFQEVPLERQQVPNVEFSINGKKAAMFDDFISLGAVDTKTYTEDQIVYAGYGIHTSSYSDYKDLDVKGKFVLIKAGEPRNADSTFVTTGTKEDTKWSKGRSGRSAKKTAAEELGAKGVFIVDNAAYEYYRKIYKNYKDTNWPGRISLINKNGNMLYFLVNESLAKTLVSDIETNATPKVIDAKIDVSVEKNATEVKSENVVAFIEGSEKPEEFLVISSHLDHIGFTKDGQINNGADDDGSGTVALLEIAEAFKTAVKDGHGPKRSILFLHVTGEEKGLLGSKHYADNDPVFPLENTVANLNIDMIGRVDPKREGDRNYIYIIGSDRLSTDLHNISEAMNSKYANIALDYTYNDENDPNRYYNRSDHYNFAKHNIPIIFYFNGTHDDYHKPGDTPDKIEYDLLENRTRLVFYTAWEVANRDNRPVVDKADVK
ncbi:M28 family peptidase [Psychroserpens algicola]|uniref:M28 family peptidase n=1 Tax=Psychroserpens algicola TaxID=1719034 RepID=UPI00195434AD|nr:M28 family peptidase [Psychroserpens algicola]